MAKQRQHKPARGTIKINGVSYKLCEKRTFEKPKTKRKGKPHED